MTDATKPPSPPPKPNSAFDGKPPKAPIVRDKPDGRPETAETPSEGTRPDRLTSENDDGQG